MNPSTSVPSKVILAFFVSRNPLNSPSSGNLISLNFPNLVSAGLAARVLFGVSQGVYPVLVHLLSKL